MPVIQNILRFLGAKAGIPRYLGVFHLVFIALTIAATVTLCLLWKKGIIKNAKRTILISSVILIALGIYKQIVLNVSYDPTLAFNYDWNSFPWHLSTIPLCIGLFTGLTNGNINKNFISYLSVFGLMTGVVGMLNPFTFEEVIGLNVYSMLCYGWMIAISVFLFYTKQVEAKMHTFWKGLPPLFMVVSLAITFNELVHGLIPSHPYVNMFSISRFYKSDVPVYSLIHNAFLASGGGMTIVEYVISVLLYLLIVALATLCVLAAVMLINKLTTTDFDSEYASVPVKRTHVSKREQELMDKINKLQSQITHKGNNPFMIHYFQNLRVNFGNNLKGSCGYVALAMILSYFDTVLNDHIIPERYDQVSNDLKVSPGIKKEIPGTYDFNKWNFNQYKEFVDQKKNTYLHAKLLDIAINQDKIKNRNWDFNFGSTCEDVRDVFKDYMKNVANISPKHCKTTICTVPVEDRNVSTSEYISVRLGIINKDSRKIYDPTTKMYTYVKDDIYDQCFLNIQYASAQVKKFAIDTIRDKGVPVLLMVGRLVDGVHPYDKSRNCLLFDGGHAIVAYAVTDNDELVCHYGWPTIVGDIDNNYCAEKNDYTHRLAMYGDSSGMYNLYAGAMAIEFPNMPHVHSNNYEIKIGEKVYYYCPDDTYINKNGETIVVTPDNWIISLHGEKECSIEAYRGNIITKDGVLKIPETVAGLDVIAIADEAFKNQSFVKTVIIPKDIPVIGDCAFEKCRSLERVVLTDDVKFIGENAFADCSLLVTIEFDGSIEKWQRIRKGKGWNAKTGSYTIYCKNGTIKKANNAYNTIFQ